ncbi:hypothetical protein Glove_139g162 [Diversispora epigaea]|uniref:Uncharacterized protein n=1 Tax=Diversispora epigaea TaxID=1348612 RepID=A0A397J4H5_9GLOM|nr:hypothetical protein Glove_139g162 [Diversispora epigaea]
MRLASLKAFEELYIEVKKVPKSIINLSNEIKKLSTSQTSQINTEQIENPISEDLKKIICDQIRHNLFVKDKYPNNIKTEKFCRDILIKAFSSNSTYSDRTKWDILWCNLRSHV